MIKVARVTARSPCQYLPWRLGYSFGQRRQILTLAIETSCDDTAVAILEKLPTSSDSSPSQVNLLFNEKITANCSQFRGIQPIVALESHQKNLAFLVQRAIKHLPTAPDGPSPKEPSGSGCSVARSIGNGESKPQKQTPDFISVTRGPGMRSNLSAGLDFAKGLAVAWGIPMIGVHHMQAHVLTPGLVAAMRGKRGPQYPFLSLLVSGGHTILLESSELNDHRILADTDVALGSALDRIAKYVLPDELIIASPTTMYGALLEEYAFPLGADGCDQGECISVKPGKGHDYGYSPPTRAEQWRPLTCDPYPWSFTPPLSATRGGLKTNSMEFTFSGITSTVERIMTYDQMPGEEKTRPREATVSEDERRAIARQAMCACFEHLAYRLILALNSLETSIEDLVVSGGVASNGYLRYILSSWLAAHGYPLVRLNFPPPSLCTDNAAMIAWAGCEMWDHGWRSDLDITARRRWPLGPSEGGVVRGCDDGPLQQNEGEVAKSGAAGQGAADAVGVLGVDGWVRRDPPRPIIVHSQGGAATMQGV